MQIVPDSHRQVEETLRESEARFQALVQNALDIVMVIDADGTIRYMSPSVERVLGYTPKEMVGTNSAHYLHPDDMERALRELEVLLSKPGMHPVAVQTRVRCKDGSWCHLESIASNLLEDPVVGGLVFNHREVTDRVRMEEEARRLNEELEERVAERTARLEATLAELEERGLRACLVSDRVGLGGAESAAPMEMTGSCGPFLQGSFSSVFRSVPTKESYQ